MATLDISDQLYEQLQLHSDKHNLSIEEWLQQQLSDFSSANSDEISKIETRDSEIADTRQSNENIHLYKNIVMGSTDSIALVNQDYKYVIVNDVCLELIGIDREKIEGHYITEVLGEDVFQYIIKSHLDQCFKGEYIHYHGWMNFLYAGQKYVSVKYSPYWDENQTITRVVVNIQDLTERKQAQKVLLQEQILPQVYLDTTDAIIVALDVNGHIKMINGMGCRILGYDENELIGTFWFTNYVPQPDGQETLYPQFLRLMAGEKKLLGYFENAVVTRRDEMRHIGWNSVLMRDEEANIIGMLSIGNDITTYKQTEIELAKSEAKFKILIETMASGSYIIQDGKLTYVNPSFARIFGYTPEEIINTLTPTDMIHPDDTDLAVARIEARFASQLADNHMAYRGIRKDGADVFIELSATLIEYEGKPAIVGSAIDVTARKQALDALHKSEARYRTIAENFPNGIVALYDHDLRYTLVGGKGLTNIGIKGEDMAGKRLRDVFPPTVYERDEPALLAALRGETVETIISNKDYFFQVTTLPVKDDAGNIIGGMVMSQNITDLKQTEAKQKDLRKQLELAITTAKLGIWHLNIETGYLDWNDQLLEIYGLTRQEFNTNLDGWRAQVHPEDNDYVNSRLAKVFEGENVYNVAFRIIRPDNEIRYITASATPVYDSENKQIALIGINRDRTEYELDKQKLKASEARYRALFNESLNPIMVYDDQARFVMLNTAAAKNLGTTPEKAVGKSINDFIPDYYDRTLVRIQKVLSKQQPIHVEDMVMLENDKKWFLSVIQPIFTDHEKANTVQIISYDITERKQAEEFKIERASLMLELEKEQEVGELRNRMISILSHELRTPLTIISTSSELLSKYYDQLSTEKRQQRINKITSQINHLENLLDEISTLSQASLGFLNYHPTSVNVEELCLDVINQLYDVIANTQHVLEFKLAPQVNSATLDRKLMHRALTNLFSNAIKYSPEGGTIGLSVTQSDNILRFAVKDQGIGIPIEDQKDLFAIFNRASNVGEIRGTGLGLSIVKEVAECHGGSVEIESKVGNGSVFIIVIPS